MFESSPTCGAQHLTLIRKGYESGFGRKGEFEPLELFLDPLSRLAPSTHKSPDPRLVLSSD